LKGPTSKSDINEPHNGYTDTMINWYENALSSAEDDYTGLSLFWMESQIEDFISEKESCYIDLFKM